MAAIPWTGINGFTLGKKYSLNKLLAVNGDRAMFAGVLLSSGDRITVSCSAAGKTGVWSNPAPDLRHPRLCAVLETGQEFVDGHAVHYIATEPVDALASDWLLEQGPLTTTLARRFLQDVVAGLHYVHHHNLVYFNLRPSTIARVNRNWLLADFALLRRTGSVDPAESRRFLTLGPQMPPDAFTGLISPAWDIYSLGVTLNQCMEGDERMRSGRTKRLPSPFDNIVRGCLEPEPASRISLEEIAGLVGVDLGKGGRSWRAMAS